MNKPLILFKNLLLKLLCKYFNDYYRQNVQYY